MARIRYFWLLLGLACLAGCGDSMPLAEVTGRVTIQGQRVTGGVIHFLPESGPQATSVLEEDGTYSLQTAGHGNGAVIGNHRVYFSPLYDESAMDSYHVDDYVANKPPPKMKSLLELPTKYLSPQTSGLSFEVQDGTNEHDVPLSRGTGEKR